MSQASAPTRARRRGLAALAAAGTAGLVTIAGCGVQATGLKVVGSAPSLQAQDAIGSASGGAGANGYSLYFFRDGRLNSVQRHSDTAVTQELVLQELIKGPDPTEQSEGFSSEIPSGLSVDSYTARQQLWAYQYSQALSIPEKAEVVCSMQVDLGAPSVGTVNPGEGTVWNNCSDFIEQYGAPAALPTTGNQPATAGSGQPSQ